MEVENGKGAGEIFRFGVFELDRRAGELRKRGLRVKLHTQPFRVLTILVEKRGEDVTREELRRDLWPSGTYVDFDHALATAINKIRQALGDTPGTPRFVETVPRRGYRFIAPVQIVRQPRPDEETPPVLSSEPARTSVWKSRWAVAAALIVLIAATVSIVPTRRSSRSNPAPTRVMLAVLPVQNLSGDPERDYLSDGLTESMIAKLGRLNPQELGVIARTSSTLFKKSGKAIDQIGRELGVNYILESGLRGSGDHLRVNSRLIRASDRIQVWTQDYDRTVRDMVAVEDDISRAVANTIRISLAPTTRGSLATARGMSPEAYQDYLRGRYLWNQRTQQGFLQARTYFEQAIEKDPSHALGYAGLADVYLGLSDYDVLPAKEAIPRAKAAARKAIELDDSMAEAHATLASSFCEFDWDVSAAENEFRRAIALNPSYATAHQWYGECMLWVGKIDQSQPQFERAKELDPLSPIITRNEGLPLFIGHRFDEYLEFCLRTLQVDSAFWPNHFSLGWAYELKKNLPEAIAEFETANRLSESSLTLAHLAHVYAAAGHRRDAENILAKLKAIAKQRYVPAVHIAMVYEGLGDKDEAFQWLEKAYDERYWWMIELKTDPRWDSLRSDPRFQDLLRRVGLVS